MQPCSRGPHLWPALTSQVKGLRDRGAYCEIKIHSEGLNIEKLKIWKDFSILCRKTTQRWNVLKERTADSLHQDKDMTSSDIWILRHWPVSWFAAEQKQNWSVQLKHNHHVTVYISSTLMFYLAVLQWEAKQRFSKQGSVYVVHIVEETQLI